MAIGTVSPVGIQQFFDNNGNPLAGGKLSFYEAGTSTPTPAYADVTLLTPLSNPVILDAAGRAPELFLAAVAYKQVLQDALGVTLWTADQIYNAAALRSSQIQVSLTGTNHNVAIPAGLISFIEFTGSASVTVTGFSGGTPGQILIVRSALTAGNTLSLLHQNTGSAAANRLWNFAKTGPTQLASAQGMAVYIYRADGLWLLVTHEQGAWIALPYSTGNYLSTDGAGSAIGTWTVDAGDVVLQHYRLTGTTLMVTVSLQNTTVSAAPTHLRVRGWPYLFASYINALPASALDGAMPYITVVVGVNNEATVGQLVLAKPNLATWTAAPNGTNVLAQFSLDIV